MEKYYNISYDIPKKIAPELLDIENRWTVHSLSIEDTKMDEDGYYLYPIRYHEDAFWIQFKYVCYGNEPLEIGVIAKTEEGNMIELSYMKKEKPATWINMKWVIPSLSMKKEKSNIFIRVKPTGNMEYFKVMVLGFMNLFEENHTYILSDETYEKHIVIFQEDEIFNPNHPDTQIIYDEDICTFIKPIESYF